MLLKCENIAFKYNEKYILKDISFHVSSGEIVGIIAPSGYGKSTLGKVLAGYLKPDDGRITIDGKDINKSGFYPVQLIFQHPEKAINPRWKMNKVIEEGDMTGEVNLKKIGIKSEWLKRYPRELSGGELQRFCILRALNPKTRFIIADEMTAMFDVITQVQIWEVIIDFINKNKVGLIVFSHDIDLLQKICSRIIELDNINKI